MAFGNGIWTPEKHRTYEDFIEMHVPICTSIDRRFGWGYAYVEMNAGPGKKWSDPGYLGSPLRAIPHVLAGFAEPAIVLCEKDRVLCRDLRHNIEAAGYARQVSIREGDHGDTLPAWINSLPERATPLGILFHDPDGPPDLQLLARVSRDPRASRLDFVVYFSATNYKRVDKVWRTLGPLDAAIAGIRKAKWFVRKPMSNQQWTFLIGTNWPAFPRWAKRGFVEYGHPDSRPILEQIIFTDAERRRMYQMEMGI